MKGKNTKELVQTLNSELESLSDFFKANKLKLNASKTKMVCFRNKRCKIPINDLNIVFDGHRFSFENNATFLGIILDEHLSWEDHCNFVGNKMARNAGILNRVKKTLPSSSLMVIYNSLIFSHYSYGLEAWGASQAKSFKRILGIQKKAIRSVTKSHWLAHTEPRMKNLKILKITDQHKAQCINTTLDMLKGRCPDVLGLSDKIQKNNRTHNLRSTTSQPSNLELPRSKGKRDKGTFSQLAPCLWNDLPEEIKSEENRYRFRQLTKNHYLETYKSVSECTNPCCVDSNHHVRLS